MLSLVVQCVVISPVCLFVSVTTITQNCLHRSSPNWVYSIGKGSDHLQLIKFWLSCALGKGVCGGVKKIWLHLTMVGAQCLHVSEHFLIFLFQGFIVFSQFIKLQLAPHHKAPSGNLFSNAGILSMCQCPTAN